MPLTPQMLLQRQMEASGSFREPVKSPKQLEATMRTISDLSVFMPTVEDLSTVLKLPIENIFQCLMHIGIGGSVGFDQQSRQGAVPMHQAKVLDRQSLLAAQQVEPALRKFIPVDELNRLVVQCQTLRSFLRMKVEDNNDFKMAHKMVRLAHEYLSEIYQLAEGEPNRMFALYIAETQEEICSLGASDKLNPPPESQASSTAATVTKPVPKRFVKGLEIEVKVLTAAHPVQARQDALTTIADWLQRVEQAEIDACCEDIYTVLSAPIKLHLAEKRSTLARLAASIVTLISIRSPARLLADGPSQSRKSQHVVAAWLDTLFKSVFVTVSTIANSADEAVRDVVVASAGASFALNRVVEALKSAPQQELKRKLLNYVAIALLALRPNMLHAVASEMTTLGTILGSYLGSNEAAVRKAARAVVIVAIQHVACLDAALAKAIEADRAPVMEAAAGGLEVFEIKITGYKQPCSASLFWHERCGIEDPPAPLSPLEEPNGNSQSPLPPDSNVVGKETKPAPLLRNITNRVPLAPVSEATAASLNVPSIYAKSASRASVSQGRQISPSIAGAMPLSSSTRRGPMSSIAASFRQVGEEPTVLSASQKAARRAK